MLADLIDDDRVGSECLPPSVEERRPLLRVLVLDDLCLLEIAQEAIDARERQDATHGFRPLLEAAERRHVGFRLAVGVPRPHDRERRREQVTSIGFDVPFQSLDLEAGAFPRTLVIRVQANAVAAARHVAGHTQVIACCGPHDPRRQADCVVAAEQSIGPFLGRQSGGQRRGIDRGVVGNVVQQDEG